MEDSKYIDIYGQLRSKIVGGYVTDVKSVEGYDKDITGIKNLIDQLIISSISYNPNNKIFTILFKKGNKLECKIDTYKDILDLKSYKVKDVKYNGKSITDPYGIVDLDKALIYFVDTQLFKSLKEEVSVINSNIRKLKKVAYTGSYQDLKDSPTITDKLGDNNDYLISLKGITEAINNVDKVLPFDGFVDDVNILNQSNPYDGGKIYFVKSVNRFAYYREEDDIYTALWNGFTRYATIIAGQGVIPNSDRIFVYNNKLYLWNGSTLILDKVSVTDIIDDTPASYKTAPSPKAVKDYVDDATSLGYAYMGIATPSTVPASTLKKMFYLATQKGDYKNFGFSNVPKYSLLMWNGSDWSIEITDVMTVEGSIVQELGRNHDKVMSQASITAEVKNVLERFTWKNINE